MKAFTFLMWMILMLNNVQGKLQIQSCASKPPENEKETSCEIGDSKYLRQTGTHLEVNFKCHQNMTDLIYNIHDDWLKHKTRVTFKSSYCDWVEINTTMFHDHSGLFELKSAITEVRIIGEDSSEVLTDFPKNIKKMFPHVEEIVIKKFKIDDTSREWNTEWPQSLKKMRLTGLANYLPSFHNLHINRLNIKCACKSKTCPVDLINMKYLKHLQTLEVDETCLKNELPYHVLNSLTDLNKLIINGEMNNYSGTFDKITHLERNNLILDEKTMNHTLNNFWMNFPNLETINFSLTDEWSLPVIMKILDLEWPANVALNLVAFNPANFSINCSKWKGFKNKINGKYPEMEEIEDCQLKKLKNIGVTLGVVLIGTCVILLLLIIWFRSNLAFVYGQKEFFRRCPFIHKKLFFRQNDENEWKPNEAILLFHRSFYCTCNNIANDDENERAAEYLKLILERGGDKLCWAYERIKVIDDGQVGKPIDWNLQQLCETSKRCIVIVSQNYVRYHYKEFRYVHDNYSHQKNR